MTTSPMAYVLHTTAQVIRLLLLIARVYALPLAIMAVFLSGYHLASAFYTATLQALPALTAPTPTPETPHDAAALK